MPDNLRLISGKYFIIGIVLLVVGSVAALYLNLEGIRCLTELSAGDTSIEPLPNTDLERDCFIITNSYVYMLFMVIIGAIVLAIGIMKKKDR